jgi:hypothetical protein
MKKRAPGKKMTIHRETLRLLEDAGLERLAGGTLGSEGTDCRTACGSCPASACHPSACDETCCC